MSADERLRLVPLPLIAGFAFSLGAVLAAVLPTRREYAQLADDQPPDAYSLAYLHVLTRAKPDDEHLRITYVRHLAKLGLFDDALQALGKPRDIEAEGLRLDLLLARARALPEPSDERRAAFEAVAVQLQAVARLPVSLDRLQALASLALELERPRLAAELLLRAGAVDSPRRAALLADAARWLRASGDGVRAAQTYQRAAEIERDADRARAYALAAIDALEAEDRVADAADLVTKLVAAEPNDVALLARAAALSSACNRVVAARDYGRRIVALSPDRDAEDVVTGQLRRELAAGDVRSALPLVQSLVRRHPNDPRLRELQAHVAEWAGRPDLALGDWLWLLGHGRLPSGAPVVP